MKMKWMICWALLLGGAMACWAQKPELVVEVNHRSNVRSVAYSTDGKILATTEETDNAVTLWDASTAKLLKKFVLPNTPWNVAFGSSKKLAISGSSTIWIYEIETGEIIKTLSHEGARFLSFSPDGRILAASGSETKLWDIHRGIVIKALADTGGTISFSPNGNLLAGMESGENNENFIVLRSTSDYRLIKKLPTKIREPMAVFSPNNKHLAISGIGYTIEIWDVVTGQISKLLDPAGFDFSFRPRFSLDGKQIAFFTFGTKDGPKPTVQIWDVTSGTHIKSFLTHFLNPLATDFSPDLQIVAGASGADITFWNMSEGNLIRTHKGGFASHFVTLASSNKYFAFGWEYEPVVELWDDKGFRRTLDIGNPEFVPGLWHRVFAMSPDGTRLASSSHGPITIWDTSTGSVTRKQSIADFDTRFQVSLWAMALSESAPPALRIRPLDLITKIIEAVGTPEKPAEPLALAPDGSILACRVNDKLTLFSLNWEQETYSNLKTLSGVDALGKVCLSPKGDIVAISYGQDIGLWDVQSGQLLKTLDGNIQWDALTFHHTGKMLVSSAGYCTQFWDVRTGRNLASLVSVGLGNWAIVTPEGRFDASPGAMEQMHYVMGLEPIDLKQFKDGFYEPDLLVKVLGFNKEPLRAVPNLADLKLYPEVAPKIEGDRLLINLKNQGGGIGAVQVLMVLVFIADSWSVFQVA